MNAWEQARNKRARRRTESPTYTGMQADPRHCHDYPPEPPRHTPERKAAIVKALDAMEEKLNGR